MEVAAAASYSHYGLEAADDDVDNLRATELRLGLPGTEAAATEEEEPRQAQKVEAPPPLPPSTPRGKKRDGVSAGTDAAPPAAK